jgi:hypothetical protein
MGTIARGAKAGGGTNLNSGQTADPAEINTDTNTIVTEINGLLDDANIETATIPGAKSLRGTEISAPSSPSSNDILLYAADDGAGRSVWRSKDAAGIVTTLSYNRMVGTGVETGTIPCVIASTFGSVATIADTTETVLHSQVIQPAALTASGEAVRLLAHGNLGANANNKTVRVRVDGTGINGTILIDTGTVATNAGQWDIDLRIVRIDATSADLTGVCRVGAAGGAIGAVSVHRGPGTTTPAITFASGFTLYITGLNGTASAGDVTCRGSKVLYEPV